MTTLHSNPSSSDALDAALAEMNAIAERAKQRRDELEVFAAGQPQTRSCPRHAHVVQRIDLNRSSHDSWEAHKENPKAPWQIRYSLCPECEADSRSNSEKSWLTLCGVPEILLDATLDTFRTETDEDRSALRAARDFLKVRKGFFILTGTVGDGKSFLMAALLRGFGKGRFITHNELQSAMRKGYRSRDAVDMVEKAKLAPLLILDDIGTSFGGADDLPMIHSVLDHRHSNFLPVGMTSNLTIMELTDLLGDRIKDRLRQSLFRHVALNGQSHRPAMRSEYLTTPKRG